VNLALGQEGFNAGPRFFLSGILTLGWSTSPDEYGEEVHDDCALLNGLFNFEEILARNPAIFNSLIPRSPVLTDADDDVHSIVTKVQPLAMSFHQHQLRRHNFTLEHHIR